MHTFNHSTQFIQARNRIPQRYDQDGWSLYKGLIGLGCSQPSHAAVVQFCLWYVHSRQKSLSNVKIHYRSVVCQKLSLLGTRSEKIWSSWSCNLNCMALQIWTCFTMLSLCTHSDTAASPSWLILQVFTIYDQFIESQDDPNWSCLILISSVNLPTKTAGSI